MAYIVDQVLTGYTPDLEFKPARVATPKTRRDGVEDNHLDFFARAKHHLEEGELERAAECCRAALEGFYERMSDREKSSAHSLYGSTLMRMQRWDEAALQLEGATRLSPAEAEHWHKLGRAYDRLGRRKDAVAALERAVEISPGEASIAKSLADARKGLGAIKGAAAGIARRAGPGLAAVKRLFAAKPEPVIRPPGHCGRSPAHSRPRAPHRASRRAEPCRYGSR